MTRLTLSNTLTRREEHFTPLDASHVRMYVCGPTVYARPHIGNARSVVVYDVLFRLLSTLYPRVSYVRNITDVDDKINAAALERGITIQQLTQETIDAFHADMDALAVLRPTHEPRATEYIAPMIAMIEQLIARGHAYAAEGHVLFSVKSFAEYGALSRRAQEDLIAGARVEVAPYKRDAGDFVLWKPASAKDDASSRFSSPWGKGRPGWHIECSAMSTSLLGAEFDIHGGGSDLMFPHHENEIAQSRCAHGESQYARCWVHNGFLTVNGEKMSKSLGNFITVRDLLDRGVPGEVVRYALLSTRYNEPLDWSDKRVDDAKKNLDRFYRRIEGISAAETLAEEALAALADNMNTPKLLAWMQTADPAQLKRVGEWMGFFAANSDAWFRGAAPQSAAQSGPNDADIETQITARTEAKKAKNFAEADRIRAALLAQGIVLEDKPGGATEWRRVNF